MRHLSTVTVCLGLLFASGCAAPAAAPAALTAVATAERDALSVTLLSAHPLAVGLNQVFYEVTRAGAPVTQATVVQKPLMTMASMQHACPLVNPEAAADESGRFGGKLVFTMPSSDMDVWTLTVEVTLPGESAPAAVKFGPLAVADSKARRSIELNGQSHVVTLSFDGPPRVGANPYFVTVHRPADAMKMGYLPVEDLTLVGTPSAPAMGHGSSGNVNPASIGGGVYAGTANFTMPGDWVLHLELLGAGDARLGTLDWDVPL